MEAIPAIRQVSCPIRLLSTHEDASYDYKNAEDKDWLHHSGICCISEYSGTLVRLRKPFRVLTGWFGDERFWDEIRRDAIGAAAASAFRGYNFAVIGNPYTGMTDMPADDHRLLKAFGKMFIRPEIEEVAELYASVTKDEIEAMLLQFRDFYVVDETVTDEHMYEAAKIAVAYDRIIRKHSIDAYGYYWWGESDLYTRLRSQSAVAGSRLASMGHPGVTEGDVKTAMGMKLMDVLGGGGMFIEFNSIDYLENFLLISHDGPVNFNVSETPPRLKHLNIHHGKTGQGLGIDFDLKQGVVTVLNITQFDPDCDSFKLIYTVGKVVPGEILYVGNPNARLEVRKPIPEFIDEWCQQGPVHHSSLGIGDLSREIESFAEATGLTSVRV
jgi:L-arabinose isomerase